MYTKVGAKNATSNGLNINRCNEIKKIWLIWIFIFPPLIGAHNCPLVHVLREHVPDASGKVLAQLQNNFKLFLTKLRFRKWVQCFNVATPLILFHFKYICYANPLRFDPLKRVHNLTLILVISGWFIGNESMFLIHCTIITQNQ